MEPFQMTPQSVNRFLQQIGHSWNSLNAYGDEINWKGCFPQELRKTVRNTMLGKLKAHQKFLFFNDVQAVAIVLETEREVFNISVSVRLYICLCTNYWELFSTASEEQGKRAKQLMDFYGNPKTRPPSVNPRFKDPMQAQAFTNDVRKTCLLQLKIMARLYLSQLPNELQDKICIFAEGQAFRDTVNVPQYLLKSIFLNFVVSKFKDLEKPPIDNEFANVMKAHGLSELPLMYLLMLPCCLNSNSQRVLITEPKA